MNTESLAMLGLLVIPLFEMYTVKDLWSILLRGAVPQNIGFITTFCEASYKQIRAEKGVR